MKYNKTFLISAIVSAVLVAAVIANYQRWLPHHWQTYTAPDGAFSIELPGRPDVEATQSALGNGGTAALTTVSVQPTRSTAYTLSYVDNDNLANGAPDKILEASRDGSLRKLQGTVISQKRLTVQGYPALDFQAETRGNSLTDSRIVLAGKRLYVIVAVAENQDREPKTVQRVFDSFKMTNP